MGGKGRWSREEQRKLFQSYFDGPPVQCPTCGQEVAFRMSHTREVVTLSMRCPGCENLAVLLFTLIVGMPAQPVGHSERGF